MIEVPPIFVSLVPPRKMIDRSEFDRDLEATARMSLYREGRQNENVMALISWRVRAETLGEAQRRPLTEAEAQRFAADVEAELIGRAIAFGFLTAIPRIPLDR